MKNLASLLQHIGTYELTGSSDQVVNYITFDSLKSAVKALNLNINEKEIKECFQVYHDEIKFEDFKNGDKAK